jgi:hypothetical protein
MLTRLTRKHVDEAWARKHGTAQVERVERQDVEGYRSAACRAARVEDAST